MHGQVCGCFLAGHFDPRFYALATTVVPAGLSALLNALSPLKVMQAVTGGFSTLDDRVVLGDNDVIAVLNKQIKQRRDSLSQYQAAGRDDLADKEAYELKVILEYMPEQLSADALNQLIGEAIAQTQASTVKDIGKVMARVKPKVQGRADMTAVSAEVRAQLLRSSE